MSDIKVTGSHLTFLGKSYFRGGAPEVEIGSYGEKKTPITKTNYLEVQGQVPASRLKIKECVTVDSDYAGTTEADLLANINLFGVFKGSSNTALKDMKEGKLKLIQLAVDNEDLESATNASPKVIQNLIGYGDDARIVDTLFVVVEASTAKSFEASNSLSLSANVGVVKVSADGGVSDTGSSSITLSKGSAFAYGLVKIQWDANQKKNKTKIVKLTDDQYSLS
jgi:hypothetical protein